VRRSASDKPASRPVLLTIGDDELSEPFATWTDGTYTVLRAGGSIMAIPPTNAQAIRLHVWVGKDLDDLAPTAPVGELETGVHKHRGHVFDADWWICGLWVDGLGKWYGFMHAEDHFCVDSGISDWGKDLRTICMWTSPDQGATWEYVRPVVTISDRYPMPPASQSSWPKNGGAGDHKLVVSPQRDFLYLLYTNFTYTKPERDDEDNAHGNLAIARCRLSPKGVPDRWWKFFDGDFTEPGVGGDETWLMSPEMGDPDNSQRTVTWSRHLERWVMIFSPRGAGAHIAFSDDLVRWDPSYELLPPSEHGYNYFNLIDYGPLGTDESVGQIAWLYYTRSDYEVHRRLVRFDLIEDKGDEGEGNQVLFDSSLVRSDERFVGGEQYDSVLGFGRRQGEFGWLYMAVSPLRSKPGALGFWSPIDFEESMDAWSSRGSRSAIGRDWQQAVPGVESARVWRASKTGAVTVTFEAQCETSGVGASALSVFHNRTKIWPHDESRYFVSPANPRVTATDELLVKRGDRIFFVLMSPQEPVARLQWRIRVTASGD